MNWFLTLPIHHFALKPDELFSISGNQTYHRLDRERFDHNTYIYFLPTKAAVMHASPISVTYTPKLISTILKKKKLYFLFLKNLRFKPI